jgi:hypothetical protein
MNFRNDTMNTFYRMIVAVMLFAPLFAEERPPADAPGGKDAPKGDTWTRELKDRSQRGTLHDEFQNVRGDTGRWSDEASALFAPSIKHKPPKLAFDDWFDQWREKPAPPPTANDDAWVLCRTRQLDDNDRLWIERIERRGNSFTIVLSEAIWQGRYSKTFTYYGVFGVHLGKLKPGKYEAKWVITPLTFKQFDGDGRPLNNWPKDEAPAPAETKPVERRVTFQVVAETAATDPPSSTVSVPSATGPDSRGPSDRRTSPAPETGTRTATSPP